MGVPPADGSQLLRRRSTELTSDHTRRAVARVVEGIARDVEGRALPGPVPVSRKAIAPLAPRLHALAATLRAVDHPVGARGVALLQEALAEIESPFYEPALAAELPALLAVIEAALREEAVDA